MTQGLPSKKRILYAFQGTGNGHSARANQLVPLLKKHCHTDVLCSGSNRQLSLDFDLDYQFEGLSFSYNESGGIDYLKTLKSSQILKFWKEVESLNLKPYDLIINDFEPVSAWAAKNLKVDVIGLGHQAAFINKNVPRPKRKNAFAEWIFKYYAPADKYLGLHFKSYGDDIFPAILREQIFHLEAKSEPYMLCYLPAYKDDEIYAVLSKVSNKQWRIFSSELSEPLQKHNCRFEPVSGPNFIQALESCEGLLCSAGFEAPAEALYLRKKLMVVPIQGQYEQYCNAQALKELGVPVLKKLTLKHLPLIHDWVYEEQDVQIEVIRNVEEWLLSLETLGLSRILKS